MVRVPQPTVEKPLGPVDYILALEQQCRSARDVRAFSRHVPARVLNDERYAKAVAKLLASFKERRVA